VGTVVPDGGDGDLLGFRGRYGKTFPIVVALH
jgi:hypothetical protein